MKQAVQAQLARPGPGMRWLLLAIPLGLAWSMQACPSRATAPPKPRDWVALLHKPYESLQPPKNFVLPPLLTDVNGQVISSREMWEKHREQLRQSWLEILGPAPAQRPDLQVHIETTERLPDHVRYLVRFRSEDHDAIRAYLLVPSDWQPGERRPAVVVFHPTTKDTFREPVGLGQRKENAFALFLTRRGYVTLSPECYIMKGEGPKPQAELLMQRRPGWTGMGKMTWDASRCLDFLMTRPEVNRQRIGCFGHSLGAKEVLYALAFEPRYAVGVFSEGGIGLTMSNWSDIWYLTDKIRPRIPQNEHHQLLALIAPRPFLILAGNSADGDLSWFYVREARQVYAWYGAADRIGFHNHRGGHRVPPEARELAWDWFDFWLSAPGRPDR